MSEDRDWSEVSDKTYEEVTGEIITDLQNEIKYINSHAIESKKIILKLEEQVKDYEQALRDYEDMDG